MSHVAFDNVQLSSQPMAHAGDMIPCRHCGKTHELKAGKDEDGKPSEILLFYHCGTHDYLAAVSNRLVDRLFQKKTQKAKTQRTRRARTNKHPSKGGGHGAASREHLRD